MRCLAFSINPRSAILRPLRGTSATLRDVERPLATEGTQEPLLHNILSIFSGAEKRTKSLESLDKGRL